MERSGVDRASAALLFRSLITAVALAAWRRLPCAFMRHGWRIGVVGFCLLTHQAQAEDLPAAPDGGEKPSVGTAAPDVVVLRNGGMAKGTISEMYPGGQVVLVLMSGKTRTFRMADVRYAGPAAGAPREASEGDAAPTETSRGATSDTESQSTRGRVRPLVTVHAEEARLTLKASEPDVTFHVSTGMAVGGRFTAVGYDRICTAPCDASMATGTYTLALSTGTDAPVSSDERVTLEAGPSTVEGVYTSNVGLRTAGWVLVVGGPAAGLATMFLTQDESCFGGDPSSNVAPICSKTFSSTGLLIGGALAVGGVLGGLALISVKDGAEIRVSPGSGAARSPSDGVAATSIDAVSGAHVHGRF